MGDVLPFRKPDARKPRKGLCQHGYHKWKVVTDSRFDVKQGKLVSVYRCERCGKEKIKAT